jgi:transposase
MRDELSDFEWTAIKPMLPNKTRGVRRVNDRRVLNGIFWVLRSGAPWRDLPENYGSYPPSKSQLPDSKHARSGFNAGAE